MFTGLIEAVGEIVGATPIERGMRVRIESPFAEELTLGESVAVNGVCLTTTAIESGFFAADVGPETLRVTTLGELRRGALVNLERPLRADGRLGGHFVQGHVDATGTIEEIRSDEDYWWLTVKFPPSLAAQIVRKGSIAVDGISLTVAGVDDRRFDVQIVPYTWEHTNLQFVRVNDPVNLEFDMIGKYVLRALEVTRAGSKT